MNNKRSTVSPLSDAVCRALRSGKSHRLHACLALAGLALSPGAHAQLFPAELELSSLQAWAGGDGRAGFVLDGIDISDISGWSVSAAGDVNGDGIGDLIVGAFFADPGGRYAAGESYVVFGSDARFAAEIELSSLLPSNGGDGSAGFVLNGIDAVDLSGVSVSAAGDVNGDGIDDLIVGAHSADSSGRENAGESYVVFGTDAGFAAEIELSSLLAANGGDGSAGFVLNGIDSGDLLGWSVSAAGDVNGDGIDDLFAGAFRADPGGRDRAGESYVVFGSDGGFAAEIELSSLLSSNGGDGSAGFVLNGIDSIDSSGVSVSAAGDVNGDGIGDLIVGAPGADPGARDTAGESYVVFGTDAGVGAELELSSLLAANGGDGSAGFVLKGIDAEDYSGRSVSTAGDINGDGIDDVIVGAYCASPGGRTDAGQSYVVFGTDTGFVAEIELSSLLSANGGDGSAGLALNGIDAGDISGFSVSAAGDINGDGIGDLIVGAPWADQGPTSNEAGESYVVYGTDAGFAAEIELSSLLPSSGGDGSAGFVLNGAFRGDQAGRSVSTAGDVNGDGIDDLVIGVPYAQPILSGDYGRTFVMFGRTDTDGDEIADLFDNCPAVANPDQGDSDTDQVGDECDNCVHTANTDQRDTNADGFGNVCDADLSNDCQVNFADLMAMKNVFFGSDPDADLDGSGAVNFGDLSIMKANFFGLPGPSGVPNICD